MGYTVFSLNIKGTLCGYTVFPLNIRGIAIVHHIAQAQFFPLILRGKRCRGYTVFSLNIKGKNCVGGTQFFPLI